MTLSKRLRRKRIYLITAWFLFASFAGGIPVFAVGLVLGQEFIDRYLAYYVWLVGLFLVWVVVVGSRPKVKCPFCNEIVTPVGNQPWEEIGSCESCGQAFTEDSLDI